MKRTLLLAGAVCLVTLVVAMPASAATYLGKTVAALKAAPVYVEPGTPGTDADTSNVLAGLLTTKDNIIIVVLPEDAAAETKGNIDEFVRRLDAATKRKWIIGLAIGDKEVGFSTKLPAGVASEQMRRAQNVTQFTLETIRTFISNIHDWQHDNPQATPKPQIKPHSKKGGGLGLWWILIFGGAAVLVGVVYHIMTTGPMVTTEEIKFKASPDPIKDALEGLYKWRKLIRDPELNDTLVQICSDTEEFFRRFGHDTKDTETFQGHLESLDLVLKKYVDVQDSQRYYDNPAALLQSTKKTVTDYAEVVLGTIRRGNRQQLTDFNVNMDILSAQKFSS